MAALACFDINVPNYSVSKIGRGSKQCFVKVSTSRFDQQIGTSQFFILKNSWFIITYELSSTFVAHSDEKFTGRGEGNNSLIEIDSQHY